MNVTFAGLVSKQVAAGEAISLTVTNPDSSQVIFSAVTESDGSFVLVQVIETPGEYMAVATIDEDAKYLSAASMPVPFTIGKESRTITLSVTVE